MTTKPKDIDDYIARFPVETQKILTEIRRSIRENIPKAEETISYGIPTFKLNGRNVIYFAGYKKHIGVYPVPSGDKILDKAFSSYKTSGKGTIQFPLDKPIPHALIAKIVKYRLKEHAGKAKSKAKPSGVKPHIEYHKGGTVMAKGKMLNDTPEGYWEWFRKDGTKLRSGYFKKGKQTGEWTTYDQKGKAYKVTKMKAS
jgi:uncharacterized protein YdhG (YjbR/CyaY superfamily)